MQSLRKGIDRVLESVLVVLMGTMVINVVYQVFSRYVLNDPSSITEELARFLLIWVGLLGAAYATGQRLHLAIDIFPNSLSHEGQKRLDIFINILVAAFAILTLIIGGSYLIYITLITEQTSAALGIPLGYIYMVLPLSGLLITIYCFLNTLDFKPKADPDFTTTENA